MATNWKFLHALAQKGPLRIIAHKYKNHAGERTYNLIHAETGRHLAGGPLEFIKQIWRERLNG